jgi:hypothetical protein
MMPIVSNAISIEACRVYADEFWQVKLLLERQSISMKKTSNKNCDTIYISVKELFKKHHPSSFFEMDNKFRISLIYSCVT